MVLSGKVVDPGTMDAGDESIGYSRGLCTCLGEDSGAAFQSMESC